MTELKGISQEEIDRLKQKYLFLDAIIKEACSVPLFNIDFGEIDDELLDTKSHGFDSSCGYEESSHFYAIEGDKIHMLGARIWPDGYTDLISPTPTIREAIATLGIEPDFIVRAYYVTKKHNGDSWEDVELRIYEKRGT
jgi:hypothetical protein